MDEELRVVFRQRVEEIDLLRDLGQHLGALLQEGRDGGGVIGGIFDRLTDKRLGHLCEGLRAHGADILGVEVAQLFDVEDGRGLGDAGEVKDLLELVQREDLPLAPGAPAEEGDIVDDRVGQKALGDQVLVGGVAAALGHLAVLVAHDGRAVDILRDGPAEALVQEVVLRGGGQILAAAHDVGDAHEVVVHDVREVVGGQAVALQEDLIVKALVLDRDVPVNFVVEGRGALMRDALADDIGTALGGETVGLLAAHVAAGIVAPVKLAAVLLGLGLLAEAAVGVAALHQKLGVFLVERAALGLDVRGDGTADVRALVMLEVALGHGLVDHVHRALDQTALVGVLDAQDELALAVAGDEIRIERRAQVADVHVARGRGREARAHLAGRDAGFHIFKPAFIFHILPPTFIRVECGELRVKLWYPLRGYFKIVAKRHNNSTLHSPLFTPDIILFCKLAVVKYKFFC